MIKKNCYCYFGSLTFRFGDHNFNQVVWFPLYIVRRNRQSCQQKKNIEQFCFSLLTHKNAEGKPKAGFELVFPLSESSKYFLWPVAIQGGTDLNSKKIAHFHEVKYPPVSKHH